jgi:hypothetical protein
MEIRLDRGTLAIERNRYDGHIQTFREPRHDISPKLESIPATQTFETETQKRE